MNEQYTVEGVATGAGRNGTVRSDDGSPPVLDFKLASPKSIGGDGDGTNPEQLFASGYACGLIPTHWDLLVRH